MRNNIVIYRKKGVGITTSADSYFMGNRLQRC